MEAQAGTHTLPIELPYGQDSRASVVKSWFISSVIIKKTSFIIWYTAATKSFQSIENTKMAQKSVLET
jgi:hypothetical protein